MTADQITAITPSPIPEPRPLWKRWWFLAAIVLVVGGGVALILANNDDGSDSAASETTEANNTDDTDDPDPTTPEATAPEISIPQFTVPDFSIPTFTIPDIPAIPTVIASIPEITVPENSVTETSGPEITVSETTVAATSPPEFEPIEGSVEIGDTVTLQDGTTIRVNAVTPNTPVTSEFSSPEPGNVLTRVDFEVCAGSKFFGSLSPVYWTATLANGEEASFFLQTLTFIFVKIAPGACARNDLYFEAPEKQPVVSLVVRDDTFQESASWDATTPGGKETAPLVASKPVATAQVGQSVALSNGGSVTLRSLTPNSPPLESFFPPDPGRQFAQVDVEVCAGPGSLNLTTNNFYGGASDGSVGGASVFGSTLPTGTIAAETCVSGKLDLDMPANVDVTDVIFTDFQGREVARWRQG